MQQLIRSKGLGRYMLRHAILGKALPMIASYAIADILSRAFFSFSFPILFCLALVPISLAVGIMLAGLTWAKNEEYYEEHYKS